MLTGSHESFSTGRHRQKTAKTAILKCLGIALAMHPYDLYRHTFSTIESLENFRWEHRVSERTAMMRRCLAVSEKAAGI
jgi:hypothetical protein